MGNTCHAFMDSELRDLDCKRLQADEIWCYVGKKKKNMTPEDNPNEVGDFWTFVALDADTKLVPCYHVGKRTLEDTTAFITDLESRLSKRIQLSTDGLATYRIAVDLAFGTEIDYAQVIKSFEVEAGIPEGKYSPGEVVSVKKSQIVGSPDPAHVSTSYVERQNLTMRMNIRRFTRLTNGFFKKVDNLKAAVALHFTDYNFCRIHQSLKVTPAMEAGVTGKLWTVNDLLDLA